MPVDPDDREARELLEQELGRGGADDQPAEPPDWWQDFLDWLRELFGSVPEGPGQVADTGGTVGIVIAVVLIAAALVIAFWVFGVPRLRRRSTVTGDLFGEDDDRSAARIRSAAQRAADAGDYTTATVEAFRSLARDLAERGIVATFPGTTARDFARRTGIPFPALAPRLDEAAAVFDDLRYLGGVGTREQWTRMSALERELRAARAPRAARATDALEAAEATSPTEPSR